MYKISLVDGDGSIVSQTFSFPNYIVARTFNIVSMEQTIFEVLYLARFKNVDTSIIKLTFVNAGFNILNVF